MPIDRSGSGDSVFLTGSSGFVGAHALRELLAAGYSVRALVRDADAVRGHRMGPQEPEGQFQLVEGTLTNPGALAPALDGCRYVVHCAAIYSFAASDRVQMRAVNVTGTAGLLEAAHLAGVERAVVTSSSATLGPTRNGHPRTEADWAADDASTGYHHSKLEQERAAFASRVPVVALLPTAPIGPGDWKPTPTGKMILDFARGKMVVKPPSGGLNLVAVEDVARAHVAALELGRPGERYILGGENISLEQIWEMLAGITGKPMPNFRLPEAALFALAYLDEIRCRVIPHAQPAVPLEGVRMSREQMFVDASKAKSDLGFTPSPVRDALERAVRWYADNGYV